MRFNEERPIPQQFSIGRLKKFELAKERPYDGALQVNALIGGLAGSPDFTCRITIKPEWCDPSFTPITMDRRETREFNQNIGSKSSPGYLAGVAGSVARAEEFFSALEGMSEPTCEELAYVLNSKFDELGGEETAPAFLFVTRQQKKNVRNPNHNPEDPESKEWLQERLQWREVAYIQYIPTDDAKAAEKVITRFLKAAEKREMDFLDRKVEEGAIVTFDIEKL